MYLRPMSWYATAPLGREILTIKVKELSPLLTKSPDTLPFPPRAVYTSSGTATFDQIKPDILDDYQLLSYGADYTTSSYKASKYCGDMVMAQLDLQLAEEAQSAQGRSVRIFTVDPGCVCTSIFDGGFGTWALYASVMKFFYWLTFYFVSSIARHGTAID